MSSRSLPLTIRAMSSMSSISRACAAALRSITSQRARQRRGIHVRPRRICVQPSTAFSGVRISWDSVARNSSLTRDASSASRARLLRRRNLPAQLALAGDPLADVVDDRDRAD